MISIPKLSFSDIAKYYSIIRVSHLGVASPVECIDTTVERSWEAPQHPTEANVFVCDTIYEQPRSITLNGHIKDGMLPVFEAQILLSLTAGIGFNIYTIGGVYNNMFVTDFSRPESADVSTGFNVSITFTEVQQATSLLGIVTNVVINLASTTIASSINTVDQGTIQPVADGASELGSSALGILGDIV